MNVNDQDGMNLLAPLSGVYSRRVFLSQVRAGATLGALSGLGVTSPLMATTSQSSDLLREFLAPYVLKRETIDRFLDPARPMWARFHPDYGYLLRNSMMRDGVNGSLTLARYESEGNRWQVNFPNEPCRINTYGDSFTQGHQISDGETWQEVLAAHFCEPIRNYGIGGFGVYQAYRRLLEIEATDRGAEFVILNIWGDDHLRSINAWRWLTFPSDVLEGMTGEMFHANPWEHARLTEAGELLEQRNPCPTPGSLYQLCDLDFVCETFGRDEVVHALAAMQTGQVADSKPLEQMAAAAGFPSLDLRTADSIRRSVNQLYHRYAIKVGIQIVKRLQATLLQQGKQLFVLLSHPAGSVWHYCAGQSIDDPSFIVWHPAEFQRYLREAKIPYIDTVERHVAEFRQFKIDAKQYVDRYYIGHYNPQGNHFFAHSIKDELRKWLDPAPPSYRDSESAPLRFEGYLPS